MDSALAPASASLRQQRNFWLVWLGQAVSRQGDGMAGIAVIWWLVEVTGSPSATATLSLAMMLPGVLLGPVAGAVIDRVDRRRLLMTTDLVRAGAMGALTVLAFNDLLQLWQLLVFGVVEGVAQAFHSPALQASIPRLVPPPALNQANSLNQLSEAGANLLAPILGGALVAVAGSAPGMAVSVAGYAVAAATLFLARIPPDPDDRTPEGNADAPGAQPGDGTPTPLGRRGRPFRGLAGEALEGLRYLRQAQPVLFYMLCTFALVNFALAPIGPLLPFVAQQRLGLGPTGYGVLTVSLTVGTIAGAALMSARGRGIRRGRGVIWGITGVGLGLAGVGLAGSAPVAAAAMAACGFCLAVAQVSSEGLFQTRVPDRLRGRVFGVRRSLSTAAAPLGLALGGALAGVAAPHLILTGAGLAAALAGLSGHLIRELPRAQ
ncbi:MAG TPA: MFS transporter [Bacillota bacterium]